MLWMNDSMMELCGKGENYHKNISSVFPEIQAAAFPTDEETRSVEIEHADRKYRVDMRKVILDGMLEDFPGVELTAEGCYVIGIHLFDITELSAYKQENYEQKPVVGLIYMDNYDEAMESVDEMRRSMLEALVDRRITKYIFTIGGLIKKTEKGKYLFVINRKNLNALEEDRFSVVEDVKTVNIGNSINVTISIGIGLNCGDYGKNCEAARIAIEMALARGGDQAVVKDYDKMAFFGGKSQRSERNTRVRARVKAQALRELIASRDRVIVMGHKITDVDSLGASVGVCRAAMHVGKPAYIVLGDMNAGIQPWVEKMKSCEGYENNLFLTHEQAIEMTNQSTAVVVVDTNIPTESIEFLAECCTAPIFADPVSTAKAVKLRSVLGRIHTLKPNRIEAELLSGVKITDDASLEEAARVLLDRGMERVFISLGTEGVLAADRRTVLKVPCYKATMRNATGAGDSFMAALSWAFLEGMELEDTAKAAAAVAAMTIESEETINPAISPAALRDRMATK